MRPRLICAACLLVAFAHVPAQDEGTQLIEWGVRESAVASRDSKQWRAPKKIVVAIDNDQRLHWLQEAIAGSGVELVAGRNPTELHERIADADGMIGPCLADAIGAGKKLRWVQTSGVGVEDCLQIAPIRDGRIILTNMQRITASTVAEHAFGLLLTLTRQLSTFTENQHEARWDASARANMIALEGKTVLVIGLGNVGTEIAKRASAFQMHVLAIRKESGATPTFVEYIGSPTELSSLAARADFVINATPLTAETKDLFDATFFEHLKRTAFFINVGRGGSVVTDDLVRALDTGVIAGAALDVVEPEPLPDDHPLWRLPNVIVTPHVADESELKRERSWLLARENLRRYVSGGKLLAVIDAKRGY